MDADGQPSFYHPKNTFIQYWMNDICENTALRDGKPIPVGGGNDFDDFEYTADQCNEVKLTEPGDCITEVTFYRDNKKYL